MLYKLYKYDQYSVIKDDLIYSVNIKDYKNTTPEQINLFSLMLNFGYAPVESESIAFSDKQIVNFWNFGKKSALKGFKINQYYNDLGIAPLYKDKIPTLKTTGAFYSTEYKVQVTWRNDESSGKIASQPQSYKREGLELFSAENEIKGSITPDIFYLYELVDKANRNWSKMTKSEKYEFLVELRMLSSNTNFLMPNELVSTLNDWESKQ